MNLAHGIAKEVDGLADGSVLEALAPILEFLLESDGGILHSLMGFLRATHNQKILGLGNPFLLVLVVQPNGQDTAGPDFGIFSRAGTTSFWGVFSGFGFRVFGLLIGIGLPGAHKQLH